MIFGRLDWASWDSILSKKSVTLGLGLVALAGSFAVLGATVLRIQNLRTTVSLPKAETEPSWCSNRPPACCDQIKNGAGYDACANYELRGRCTIEQCYGSTNTSGARCADASNCNKAGCKEGECNYGVKVIGKDANGNDITAVDCHAPNPSRSCACGVARDAYCKSSSCSIPQAVNTNTVLPMISEQNVSLAPTFTWAYTTAPTGGEAYANVRIWSCQAQTDACMVYAATRAPSYDGVSILDFYREPGSGKGTTFAADWNGNNVSQLKPNTRYWWQLTWGVSSCGVKCVNGIPGDTRYPCTSWGFVTGSGGGGGGGNTCTVSLSAGSINTNQSVTVTTTGVGAYAAISSTVRDIDLSGRTGIGRNTYNDSEGHKYYEISGNTLGNLPAGTYKLWCGSGQCSGNPFCPYENQGGTLQRPACDNYYSCSDRDNAQLSVTNPAGWCSDNNGCDQTKKCENNQCVDVVCPAVVYACKQYVVRDHACNLDNKTSGIACTTDSGSAGTCSSGTCVQNAPVCSLSVSNLPPGPYRVGDPDKTVTISKSPANARLFCTSSNSGVVSVVGQTSGSDTATCTFHVESAGTAILTAQLQLIGDTGAGLCGDPASIEVTTQAADYCTSVSQCPDNKTCTNNVCVDVCTSAAPTCKQNVAANHACTTRNVADNTACTTGGNLPGTCQSGVCTLVCSSPQTKCGNACVNLQSDTSNCGACGNACGTGQGCYSGVCSTPKTCSVSLSSGNVTTGTPVTVTTSGSGGTVSTYISREDNQTISGFGDPRTVNGHTYYQLSGSSPYTLSGLPATRYKVWCDVTE